MNDYFPIIRWASLLAFLVATSVPAVAENTLTRDEVSDGWILLFDGETSFGWASRGPAQWVVADGELTTQPGSGAGMLATTTEFADFELKVDFWIDATANSGVFLRAPTRGDITAANAYEVNIYDAHAAWPTGSINEIGRVRGSPRTVGRWNTYHLTAQGDELVVRLNGQPVLEAKDAAHTRGVIAVQQYNGQGTVKFRNIRLKPLGLKPIFNGRDLTGWREIPDRKSIYSVTPEGFLNVKNGNGDLQTEAVYGDFIFQLDIISNGQHLNSGVFFRAIPGQFWSGYESQIRNQWEGSDRTKPVDFGTGGIYNRQPARRVISSDHAWFTKTIVAHGPHLAVWVDGIQVSDFTDTRPSHTSARQGYRAEPGVITLQGHDPTTDLSFRNLRITELPPVSP